MKKNLYTYLAGNEYPGRGICIGRSPDGTKAMIAYWIMGRSANSRNACSTPCRSAAASAPWQRTPPSWRTPA